MLLVKKTPCLLNSVKNIFSNEKLAFLLFFRRKSYSITANIELKAGKIKQNFSWRIAFLFFWERSKKATLAPLGIRRSTAAPLHPTLTLRSSTHL